MLLNQICKNCLKLIINIIFLNTPLSKFYKFIDDKSLLALQSILLKYLKPPVSAQTSLQKSP